MTSKGQQMSARLKNTRPHENAEAKDERLNMAVN